VRYVLPLLGWLVVGTLVALLTMAQLEKEQEPPGMREMYYALAVGQEVSIRLLADEPRLRILAHLETPHPGIDDESITWLYGLELTLTPTDSEPYTREHWTRSRRTILPDGSRALYSSHADRVVTDSRIIEIEPGHLLPEGGMLTLRPLLEQQDQRLLIRVYRERPTQPLEQTRLFGSPEKQTVRTAEVYPFDWDNLEDTERDNVMGWIRERLHAESQTAESVPLHRLAPPSPAPTVTSEGWLLEAGHATAVNLRGPCTLNVATELAEPGPGAQAKGVPLDAELVDASLRPIDLDDAELNAFRWEVPAGALWSLRWTNPWEQGDVLMRFTVSPPAGKSWGEPPGAGGEQPQAPELRRLAHFRADHGLVPIVVPVATGADWGSLRVDARPLPSAEWVARAKQGIDPDAEPDPDADPAVQPEPLPEPTPVRVSYSAYDEDGKLLGEGSFEASFEHAPYERYVESELPWVSEETQVHLFHPFRATTLEFTADGPVDLRFLVPIENEPERHEQYALPDGWTGRYAPWELAPYISLAPLNTEELIGEQRLSRIDATVRIEPSQRSAGYQALHTELLLPEGEPPAYPLVERFRNGATWQPWHRTWMAGPTRIEIPASGELTVDYRVPSGQAGQPVTLRCGERELRIRIDASAGFLRFAGLDPGEQTCQLQGPTGAYLARAPGDGDRWTRRMVYRGDSTTLQLPASVGSSGRTVIYVRAYTPTWADPPTIITELDGGRPRRHGGPSTVLSRANRSVQPVRTGRLARLEDAELGDLVAWEGIRLVLGDDLIAGQHSLTVRVQESERPSPVYLRFESTDGNQEPTLPEHWAKEVKCELAR
jgi:hypothetical protein